MDHATELADRPTLTDKEIEVTPEMIEAGVLCLFEYDPNFSNENGIVTEILTSMLNVSPHRERLVALLRNPPLVP
jgi:hypothetical protein